MAEETENDVETPKTKTSTGTKLLVVLLVMQMIGLLFLAYSMMGLSETVSKQSGGDTAMEESVEEPEEVFEPEYIQVGPLTVNLKSDKHGKHLVYTKMLFRCDNQEAADFVTNKQQEIDNELILLFSDKRPEEISDSAGKKQLVLDIISQIQQKFENDYPSIVIGDVLFKEFIIQ